MKRFSDFPAAYLILHARNGRYPEEKMSGNSSQPQGNMRRLG